MQIDAATLDKAASYRLMISAIAPRPIAWVGSISADGVDNLAPFSYFMGVSSAPPRLAISVARGRGGTLKHTARNILATNEFTVSTVEEDLLAAMHDTSRYFAESEFDAVHLARAPSSTIAPPRPSVARVAMECRLYTALDLESTHLFIGDVLTFHVADELYKDGVVDILSYRPVARLGGDDYAFLGQRVTLR